MTTEQARKAQEVIKQIDIAKHNVNIMEMFEEYTYDATLARVPVSEDLYEIVRAVALGYWRGEVIRLEAKLERL